MHPLLLIPLLLVWIATWSALHLYLWRRLVRDTGLSGRWRRAATALVVVLAALLPVTELLSRVFHVGAARTLAWPAFLWMGFFLYTLLSLVVLGMVGFATRRAKKLLGKEVVVDPTRRQFIARVSAGTALSVATATVGHGVMTARGAIDVRESDVELARWPASLDGFAIVQLTDLHAGMTVDRGYVADVVQRANAARPDLIVVTGDIADGDPGALREVVAPLGQLSAPQGGYLRGHYRRGDSQMYVSRGTGYWGLPIRVAAPPEISRLVLHRRS
jgi:hypothetical protein